MITAENILQETRLWPQFEQLKLAMRLFERALAQMQAPIDEDRQAAFRRVRGMLKGLPGAEEFRREKKRELEIEERRYAERFGHRVALARRVNGELVTSDHHELEPLAQAGVCKINFFR